MIPLPNYLPNLYHNSRKSDTNNINANRRIQSGPVLNSPQQFLTKNHMVETSSGFMMQNILKSDTPFTSATSKHKSKGQTAMFLSQVTAFPERNKDLHLDAGNKTEETSYAAESREYDHFSFAESSRVRTVPSSMRNYDLSEHTYRYQEYNSHHPTAMRHVWDYPPAPAFLQNHYPQACYESEQNGGGAQMQSSDSSSCSSPYGYGYYSDFYDGKKKRTRTIFSKEQITELEKAYASCRYLTGALREEIANKLQMSSCQVKIWFQNKRNKEKRENKTTNQEESDDSKETTNSAEASNLSHCDKDELVQEPAVSVVN